MGVSLCVDVRLCRESSCTWPDGDALVSRCAAWWVSPCVGVSLCVDVRLCRESSCTWPDGDALVSRGLVPGV